MVKKEIENKSYFFLTIIFSLYSPITLLKNCPVLCNNYK